jgi:hypothetical protein
MIHRLGSEQWPWGNQERGLVVKPGLEDEASTTFHPPCFVMMLQT